MDRATQPGAKTRAWAWTESPSKGHRPGRGMDRVSQQGAETRGKEQGVTQRNMKEKSQPNQVSHRPVLFEKLNRDKKRVFSFCPVGYLQFRSVTQSCPTLCDPMDCSMLGFPVLHYLLEFA